VVSFFWLSHQYPTCIPPLPHSCYILCPSHTIKKSWVNL
jgi:hypothetical protein